MLSGIGRALLQHKLHVAQQTQRSFFGSVFQSDRFSITARKHKGHFLIRLRQPAGAIEFDALRLDARGDPRGGFRVTFDALGIRRAHQVDLHRAAAIDVSFLPSVLTGSRMDHIVAVAGLTENDDAHVLQQTGVLALEFRGLRGSHLENGAVLLDLFEIDTGGLTRNVERRGRRRIFAFYVADPIPPHVGHRGHRRKHHGEHRRPACIPGRFTSQHKFS